jgi:hypothetical protein
LPVTINVIILPDCRRGNCRFRTDPVRMFRNEMTQRLVALLVGCGPGLALIAAALFLRAIPPLWLACSLAAVGLFCAVKYWLEEAWPFVWSVALFLAVTLTVIPWPGLWMLDRAERLAAGEPYCIQVADGADYRPASTWLDFSLARLRPKIEGGLAMQFHAVLAVGAGSNPAVYNWSHRDMAWRNQAYARASPVVSCQPRANYNEIPVFRDNSGVDADVRLLRFAGRSFAIPSLYQPGGHAASDPMLHVTLNLKTTALASCGDMRRCLLDWVEVYLNPVSVMSRLNDPADASTRLMDEGAGPAPIRTRIDCFGENCTQYFLYDGMLFRFHMKDADLGAWRQLQQRLIQMFDSWRANR